jgi:hypothetical protein
LNILFGPPAFVFPQHNFYSPYETPGFGSNKPIVKDLQEVLAFMHEAPDSTFLREISRKNADGRELLRICVSAAG